VSEGETLQSIVPFAAVWCCLAWLRPSIRGRDQSLLAFGSHGQGGGGQNKRQDVNTTVKPANFAMNKRQILRQELSGKCQLSNECGVRNVE
jgi:hypothetical protein